MHRLKNYKKKKFDPALGRSWKARKRESRCDAGSKRATNGSSFYDHAVTRLASADLEAETDGCGWVGGKGSPECPKELRVKKKSPELLQSFGEVSSRFELE